MYDSGRGRWQASPGWHWRRSTTLRRVFFGGTSEAEFAGNRSRCSRCSPVAISRGLARRLPGVWTRKDGTWQSTALYGGLRISHPRGRSGCGSPTPAWSSSSGDNPIEDTLGEFGVRFAVVISSKVVSPVGPAGHLVDRLPRQSHPGCTGTQSYPEPDVQALSLTSPEGHVRNAAGGFPVRSYG